MEPNFQTSFIPKKPIVEERTTNARPVGIFSIISIFILVAVSIASAGLFFYTGILHQKISKMEDELISDKNSFEPSKISELQLLDKRLHASSEVLAQHITVSPIFTALSAITMKSVRFTQFNYDLATDKDKKIVVKMKGIAVGYSSIALQSDLFSSKDEGKNFIDPVFSNLTLDDKGNVIFDLEFAVDPKFVDYKATLAKEI
ncbi:MAG: hypothetical protein WCI76_02705 [bacterium]